MKRKILVVVMTLLMVATMIPSMVFAESPVTVTNQDELEAAISTAKENETTTIILSGDQDTYQFPTCTEYTGNMKNKTIVFKADGDKTFAAKFFNVNGTQNLIGANLTFDGVNVDFPADSWYLNGYTGLNLAGGKLTYKNCTISGAQYLYVPTAEFVNCVFENDADSYSVITYAAEEVTFTDCTFNTAGKAVLVYNDYAMTTEVKLTNCKFFSDGSAANDKAAVETGKNAFDNNETGATDSIFNITFTDCESDGFVANNSDSPLWGNKNSMEAEFLTGTVDGVSIECAVVGEHIDIETVDAVAPTCTEKGTTAGTICKACGIVEGIEEIPATEHSFENGVCKVCKAKDPAYVAPGENNANNEKGDGAVQTGDDFNMAIPFMLALMALAGMGAAVVARKRNTN